MRNLKATDLLIFLGLAGLSSGLSGCSLSGKNDSASIHLDLSSLDDGSRFSLLESGSVLHGLGAPPAAASGFACYAVNVTGPGIPDSGRTAIADPSKIFNEALTIPGRSCNYAGVVSPPVFLRDGSAEVALQVPPGAVRLIQVVGVNDTLVCASGVIGGGATSGTNTSGSSRYFEVGRAVLRDLFSDASVGVASNWPTGASAADDDARAARAIDCGAGCGVISSVAQVVATSTAINSNLQKYAFKLSTVPGKYIREVAIILAGYATLAGDTVAAKVSIGTAQAGAAISTVATSGYTRTVMLPGAVSPTPAVVKFDLSTANGYLQMQSGTDYWVILESPNAVISPDARHLILAHNEGATGNPEVQYNNGVSWSPLVSGGVIHYATGCSN